LNLGVSPAPNRAGHRPAPTVEWEQHVVGVSTVLSPDSRVTDLAATAHERCDQRFE